MFNSLAHQLKYLAIIGIVPFSTQPRAQILQRRLTLLTTCCVIALAIYTIVFKTVQNDLLILIWASGTVFGLQIFTMAVILVEVSFTYKAHFRYFEQARHFKLLYCRELRVGMDNLPRRYYYVYTMLIVISFVSMLSTALIILIMACDYYYFWNAVLAVWVMRSRFLQLMLYIRHQGHYLSLLAMKLKAVVSYRIDQQQTCLDVNYKYLSSFDYLLSLKVIYNELYKLNWQFNENYGWSMLSLFVVFFLDITVNVYMAILTMAGYYKVELFYLNCSSLVPLSILLISFCSCCEYCKRQHRLIVGFVSRLSSTTLKQADLSIYNDLLDEFSMQVQQDQIETNAKNFMSIDYNLLMTLFTAMVSYLTILMQFRITDFEYMQRTTAATNTSTA